MLCKKASRSHTHTKIHRQIHRQKEREKDQELVCLNMAARDTVTRRAKSGDITSCPWGEGRMWVKLLEEDKEEEEEERQRRLRLKRRVRANARHTHSLTLTEAPK